jgi:hypothetical protein
MLGVLGLGAYLVVRGHLSPIWGRFCLYFLPVVMCLAVLFPSWRLHGPYSYRYLLLETAGLAAVIAAGYDHWRSSVLVRRVLLFCAVAYIAYCGVDTFTNVPYYRMPKDLASEAQFITAQRMQVVVGPLNTMGLLQSLLGNQARFRDSSARPAPGLFVSPDEIHKAAVIGFLDVPFETRTEILGQAGLSTVKGFEARGRWWILKQ